MKVPRTARPKRSRHPAEVLDDFDRQMIAHAAARGDVLVRVDKGIETRAVLLSWLGSSRNGRNARVQFKLSGRERTVPTWQVRPAPPEAAS